jgi:hypothetical protein
MWAAQDHQGFKTVTFKQEQLKMQTLPYRLLPLVMGMHAIADRHLLQGWHQGKAHRLVLQGAAEISVPKVVSAVVDIDPAEFKRYLLRSFKQ